MKQVTIASMTLATVFMLALVPAPCVPKRDAHGRIARDYAELHRFMRATGHPYGWRNHVVDHKYPLCGCGLDKQRNMQWQRVDSAKVKDIWERKLCESLRHR